jgi:hypothetical protein
MTAPRSHGMVAPMLNIKLRNLFVATALAISTLSAVGCVGPDDTENTASAEGAIYVNLDPTALLAFANLPGASHDEVGEVMLTGGTTPTYATHDGVEWDTSTSSGLLMRWRVFELLQGGEIWTDEEIGLIGVHTSEDHWFAVVEADGYVTFAAP